MAEKRKRGIGTFLVERFELMEFVPAESLGLGAGPCIEDDDVRNVPYGCGEIEQAEGVCPDRGVVEVLYGRLHKEYFHDVTIVK